MSCAVYHLSSSANATLQSDACLGELCQTCKSNLKKKTKNSEIFQDSRPDPPWILGPTSGVSFLRRSASPERMRVIGDREACHGISLANICPSTFFETALKFSSTSPSSRKSLDTCGHSLLVRAAFVAATWVSRAARSRSLASQGSSVSAALYWL